MVCFYLRGANRPSLSLLRFILFCFIFLFSIEPMVQAQTRNHTVSGFIREAATGESLLGANVYIKEPERCNDQPVWFYSITLPAGQYTLVILPGFQE